MHCWARPGVQYHCESIQLTISGTTSRWQWACHQLILNALACSVFWSPPDVIHHWWCRLASLHWESSNLGCPWARKPHVQLPLQRLVLGSFYRDHAVRASTCLQGTVARGRGSLSLGTYDAPTSYMPLKFIDIRPLLRYSPFFSERSEGGQPLGQRTPRPRKSNNLTLRKDRTCSWRGQFELGNTWCTNMLSITEDFTGWNTA